MKRNDFWFKNTNAFYASDGTFNKIFKVHQDKPFEKINNQIWKLFYYWVEKYELDYTDYDYRIGTVNDDFVIQKKTIVLTFKIEL